MVKDLSRAKRIASVLELMERVSRSELVESTRLADDAKQAHDEAMASLTSDDFLSGPFIDLLAKRLPRLAVAAEVMDQRRAKTLGVWQGRQMRAVASTRLVDEAQNEHDRQREGRDLAELLELLQNRPLQASGKSGE